MSGTPWGNQTRARNWDALAAIIAALIGAFALVVSGYTAYLQRTQVRAQVWPYLMLASYDTENSVKLLNKGVGPAIVKSVRVTVDGKPQRTWREVVTALGLERVPLRTSTITDNVVSGGEVVPMLVIGDEDAYHRFRKESARRSAVEICYCSTLEECWLYAADDASTRATQKPVDSCPVLPPGEAFGD
ncbi:hypothetical protein FHW12_002322 [Dokdonella fugitiva]|uniref:Uncharacterized protein n=1 Tax=Dokdonella fugitiva TaxID=328517 RepID=A0A839F3I3_9GAMM|nr:hypothetical protein [Dokdonella fugitiva]MBA8888098.1 hypothetical protein [Dokdonella fugitiva]